MVLLYSPVDGLKCGDRVTTPVKVISLPVSTVRLDISTILAIPWTLPSSHLDCPSVHHLRGRTLLLSFLRNLVRSHPISVK